MRLICTLDDQKKGLELSSYLASEGIENQLEIVSNTDWGSADYGNIICRIWANDEDLFEKGMQIANEFLNDPENPRFKIKKSEKSLEFPFFDELNREDKIIPINSQANAKTPNLPQKPRAILTSYIFLICALVYLISAFTMPQFKTSPPKDIPLTPLYTPQINKELMYDYPHAYELIDRLEKAYGFEKLKNPETLPKDGQYLLKQFYETPYWHGFYSGIINYYKKGDSLWPTAPMFEKIQEGEVWRLVTPIFLHSDIFHIFFNMVWLLALGRQIEERIGKLRYIFIILIMAIFSNTAQYLMGGANFIGISGVLCGMLTFIWFRQKRAGWEGYQLHPSTMGFVTFFILFMFSLQLISFLLEMFSTTEYSVGIANTAHLSGALCGIILARFRCFSWIPKHK